VRSLEHCIICFHNLTRPLFLGVKSYEVKLNRTVKGTSRSPISRATLTILPSLTRKSSQLDDEDEGSKKSINQQLIARGGPGESISLINFGTSLESFCLVIFCLRELFMKTPRECCSKLCYGPQSRWHLPILASSDHRIGKIILSVTFAETCHRQFHAPVANQVRTYMCEIPDSPQIGFCLNNDILASVDFH
jgi:hypothetical protein